MMHVPFLETLLNENFGNLHLERYVLNASHKVLGALQFVLSI